MRPGLPLLVPLSVKYNLTICFCLDNPTHYSRACIQPYNKLGLLADVLSDLFFYAECRRTFPDHKGLRWVLLFSLLLPCFCMSLVLSRRLGRFRKAIHDKKNKDDDNDEQDEDAELETSSCWSRFKEKSICSQIVHVSLLLFFLVLVFKIVLLALFFFVMVVAIITIVLVFLSSVCMLLITFASDLAGIAGRDLWESSVGLPQEEFLPMRGILIALLEDLPNLTVQIWVLVTPQDGHVEFSSVRLIVSLVLTLLNLINQTFTLHRRVTLLQQGGLPIWDYLGNLFGLSQADSAYAKAYANLIWERKYPSHVIYLRNSNLNNDDCIDLVNALVMHQRACRQNQQAEETRRCFRQPTIAKHCRLLLGDNQLGDTAVEHIAKALQRKMLSLQALDLAGNMYTDEGLLRLSAAIKEGAVLSELGLRRPYNVTLHGMKTFIQDCIDGSVNIKLMITKTERMEQWIEEELDDTGSVTLDLVDAIALFEYEGTKIQSRKLMLCECE